MNFRKLCTKCLQPDFSCYCHWLNPVDPNIDFVILIHPIEFRKRIATGRMCYLSLQRSRLLMGCDYSNNAVVNEVVNDPARHCVMLYPKGQSKNLSNMSV